MVLFFLGVRLRVRGREGSLGFELKLDVVKESVPVCRRGRGGEESLEEEVEVCPECSTRGVDVGYPKGEGVLEGERGSDWGQGCTVTEDPQNRPLRLDGLEEEGGTEELDDGEAVRKGPVPLTLQTLVQHVKYPAPTLSKAKQDEEGLRI